MAFASVRILSFGRRGDGTASRDVARLRQRQSMSSMPHRARVGGNARRYVTRGGASGRCRVPCASWLDCKVVSLLALSQLLRFGYLCMSFFHGLLILFLVLVLALQLPRDPCDSSPYQGLHHDPLQSPAVPGLPKRPFDRNTMCVVIIIIVSLLLVSSSSSLL